jgi:hypothetical protein
MQERIENAIKELTKRSIEEGIHSADALRFTQSALNLAHVQNLLFNKQQ